MRLAARALASGFLVASLAGCGYIFGDEGFFRDRSQAYREAVELDVIEVPPGKDSAALQELYAIPPVRNDLLLAGDFEVPRPAPLAAGAAEQLVRIQKLGEDSWALIGVAPGQLWPQVRSFLSAAGVQVASADARQGIIESDWLQLQNASGESRFRYRIERGVQRGTSELHVLQKSRLGEDDEWPPVSDDLAQESDMLRSVAQYIANSAETAPVSMMADQAISAGGRVSLEEDADGETYIALGLPFNRAWASLALALEDASFEIADRDRSAGRYYLRFLGSKGEDEGGWFAWLSGGDDDHPLADRRFLLTVDALDGNAVTIRLAQDDDGVSLEKRQHQSLLARIQGNIN
jgi:outer membrane protein assembly factor BamC